MDTEWTYIREPIESNSMVLKGLLPETEYQFVIRAVNAHGASPPSHINNPVRTLGKDTTLNPQPASDSQETAYSLRFLVSLISTTFSKQNQFEFSFSTKTPTRNQTGCDYFPHHQSFHYNETFVVFPCTVFKIPALLCRCFSHSNQHF